ncbi:MAG: hypothetical protein AB7P07_10935 [Hyphomonadaceae bacterium]
MAITPAELATRLVVEASLPMIQDKVQGSPLPVQGRVLTAEDRVRRGMADALAINTGPQSTTISYDAGGEEVLFDLHSSQASVLFFRGDSDRAITLLDQALKRAYPQAVQEQDIAHPDANGMRVRLYRIQLDPALIATIEASYPAPGGGAKQFIARVRSQIKKDVHDRVLADFLATQKKH